MMTRRVFASLVVLSFGAAGQTPAPAPKTIRALFIGNSYTYYNNLPRLVEAIAAAEAEGPRFETEMVARGGATLKWHWEDGKALAAIRKHPWDFVILQEHSLLGAMPASGAYIGDPALYFEYAQKFDAEIKKAGAKTLLYGTWARENLPEQQRRLDDAFTRLARQIDASIVPVALAWTVARIEAPGLRLHMPDRSHPTAAGSYLAALTFYTAMTDRSPVNMPAVVTGPILNAAKDVTLVNLTWSDVVSLETFAQRATAQEPLRPHRAERR